MNDINRAKDVVVPVGGLAVLSLVDALEGEEFKIVRKSCSGCDNDDEYWSDYNRYGKLVVLTKTTSPLSITLPGTYRVEPIGILNPDIRVCVDDYQCGIL